MPISDIINPQITPQEEAKDQIIQTCKDLIKQTDGTVSLIKSLTDTYGKNAIINEMNEQEVELFELIWSKINSAASGTDYVVPTLVD